MTNDASRSPRAIDAATLHRVRGRLADRGIGVDDPIAFIDLTDDGVVTAIVAGTATGRMAVNGAPPTDGIVEQYLDTDIRPDVLDRLIADHLIERGRVDAPDTDEWTTELRRLAARGRARLATSDGAFLMGHDHVRLFRVTRDDVAAATAPLADQVFDIADDESERSTGRLPAALVLCPSHQRWPGLPDLLAASTDVPIVVLDDDTTASRPTSAHGLTAAPESGDFPAAVAVPEAVAAATGRLTSAPPPADGGAQAAPPANQVPPAQPAVPTVQPSRTTPNGFDDDLIVTDRIGPVDDTPSGRGVRAYSGRVPAGTARLAERLPTTGPLPTTGLSATAPQPVDSEPTETRASDDAHPAGVRPPTSLASIPRDERRPLRQLLAGVAAVGVIAFVITATAFAMKDDAEPGDGATVASQRQERETATPREPTYADPGQLNEARRPAAVYTPPPPPPPTTETATQEQRQEPRRPARPRPRPAPPRRTIPNPIPGLPLPPIVLP
ncbi:hypothetical protein GCM10009624_25760 [Gordonia sinesedis]